MKKLIKVKVEVVFEVNAAGEIEDTVSAILSENLVCGGIITDWQYLDGKPWWDQVNIDPDKYKEGDAFIK